MESSAKILVVDDDEASRYVIARDLREAGFEVIEGTTAADALASSTAGTDLVVLDVKLPDVDGIEVCRRLKSQPSTWGVPVLHVSAARPSFADQAAGLEAGADAYLLKPVDPIVLRATVRALLRIGHATRAAHAEHAKHLRRIVDAQRTLMATDGATEEILQLGARHARELTRADGAIIEVLEGGHLVYRAGAGAGESHVGLRLDVDHSLSGAVLRTGETAICVDCENDARINGAYVRTLGARSMVVVPLSHEERRDGVLKVYSHRPYGFDADALESLAITSGLIAAALARAEQERERRDLQLKLTEASRLVAVGTLASGIAHEINNPLSYVVANVDWANEEIDSIVESQGTSDAALAGRLVSLKDALGEVLHGATRVRTIVSGLRTFSRGDAETRCEVDPERVVRASLDVARNEIERHAHVQLDLSPTPKVLASEARLGQVVLNLLINAAQAIPEGASPNEHTIVVRTSTDARGWASIRVEDTGVGIAPEHMSRLFEPFFTTKPIGKGTGLGLAICHGIVTSFGGTIEVSSELGRGARFVVALPPANQP